MRGRGNTPCSVSTSHSSEGSQNLVKLLGRHLPHQLEVWSALDAVNEQRDSVEIEELHS